MTTQITLNRTDLNDETHDPEVGNYYLNTRTQDLYVLTCYSKKFWLSNVTYGSIYNEPSGIINGVFGEKQKDFKLIKKVEITI